MLLQEYDFQLTKTTNRPFSSLRLILLSLKRTAIMTHDELDSEKLTISKPTITRSGMVWIQGGHGLIFELKKKGKSRI